QRASRSDARSAVFASFHHKNSERETADDSVPNREVLRCRKRSHRELKCQRSARSDDRLRNALIVSRIGHIDSRSPNGDSLTFAVESCTMGMSIYSPRHTTNDYQSPPRKVVRQTLRHTHSVWRRMARSDHAHPRLSQ